MNLIPDKLQPYAKGVVTALGGLAAFLVLVIPQLPDDWQAPLVGLLAIATTATTVWVPNLKKFIDEDPVDTPAVETPDTPAVVVGDDVEAPAATPDDPDAPAAGVPPSDDVEQDESFETTHDGSVG